MLLACLDLGAISKLVQGVLPLDQCLDHSLIMLGEPWGTRFQTQSSCVQSLPFKSLLYCYWFEIIWTTFSDAQRQF